MTKPSLPDFPFVLKSAAGGEGRSVWLIHNAEDLNTHLQTRLRKELEGVSGFVIQEYIPNLQRDLRVVVIGDTIISYWRSQEGFLHNLACGGVIDLHSDPHLQQSGQAAARELCAQTGINLAGFDLIFPETDSTPFFLEINYTFGRTGLGGSEVFYGFLNQAVAKWSGIR